MPEGFADLQGLRDEGALLTAAHVQYLQDSAADYVLTSLQQEATYQGGYSLHLLSRVLHDLDGVMASAIYSSTRPVEATPEDSCIIFTLQHLVTWLHLNHLSSAELDLDLSNYDLNPFKPPLLPQGPEPYLLDLAEVMAHDHDAQEASAVQEASVGAAAPCGSLVHIISGPARQKGVKYGEVGSL